MGNSSYSQIPKFRWDFIRRDDHYDIYQNQYGALAEKHLIPNNPKVDNDQELDIYYQRYNNNGPIVKVYKADFDQNSDMCSNHKNIEVFTEYIPYRLHDTRNMTHEQGLYVFSEALRGFYQLYQQIGCFPVDQSLIGFNQEGRVKVWHSPNFAKNHFDRDSIILMSTISPHDFDNRMIASQEQEMVDTIWQSVDAHAIFEPYFRESMERAEPLSFRKAKQIVDAQIQGRNSYIPPRLRLEDKYGIKKLSESKRLSSQLDNSNYSRMRNRY